MVIRKITLIIVMAILFGAFLIVQPRYQHTKQEISIEDRLPDATWRAIINCVNLSKEINNIMFRYKMPYRDLITPDVILSQAKIYGIRLMEPIFTFYNSTNDWGIIASLSENVNLKLGIERLRHFFTVKEIFVNRQKVYKIQEYNAYIFKGYNYICIYVGDEISKQINRIANAKNNQISPEWIKIIHKYQQTNNNLIVNGQPKELKNLNFEYIDIFPKFDSINVYINTHLISKDTIPLKLKPHGRNFQMGEFTKRAINLHIYTQELKERQTHPIYRLLQKQSKKIRLPFDEFIQQWDGDISFREGGWININETYIDYEIDENFEISEVQKTRQRQVVGFDLYYSLNKQAKDVRKIFEKNGFMTQQEKKYHFLISPPLNFKRIKNDTTHSHSFYTSKYEPKMIQQQTSYLLWTHKQTVYNISIDSITTFGIYGNICFSPEKLNLKSLF